MANRDGHSYGSLVLSTDAYAHLGNLYHNHYYAARDPIDDKYGILYRSLSFTGINSRLRNVKAALPGTCEWLWSHESFLSWMDHSKIDEHQGLLWIKGKPGSGKSTIMKETFEWAQQRRPNERVLSYFFNARASDQLEKSCLGLYRSLTYQLLSGCEDLRSCFLADFATKVERDLVEPWTLVELQNFILKILRRRYIGPLSIFIDALDEGEHDEVWGLIDFFQKATKISKAGSILRVCLASRHYPQIHTGTGLSVVLEEQTGHVNDIAMYIEDTLPGEDNAAMRDIKKALVSRADGIFLWVVLTISLLRPMYSRGQIEPLKDQIFAMPADLHDLFATILATDLDNVEDCVTLLQWMLVAQRPLSATELCLAIQFRHSDFDLDLRQLESSHTKATALRRIVDCSRGLVGPTHGSSGCMQLIHESVRQFLISADYQFKHAHMTCKFDLSLETSHAVVAETCLNFLLHLCRKAPFDTYWYTDCPLAPFAATEWFHHLRHVRAERGQRALVLATELLRNPRNLAGWAQIFDVDMMRYDPDLFFRTRHLCQPAYYAARLGILPLLTKELLQASDLNKQEGYFGTVLQAACYDGAIEMVQTLLDHGAEPNVPGGEFGFALQAACAQGYTYVVSLLLGHGAHVNAQGGRYFSALVAASNYGHKVIVEILLRNGATTQVNSGQFNSALLVAASHGHIDIVRVLLAAGADVNEQKKPWGSALYIASKEGYEDVVQALLDNGADVNLQGGMLGTALLAATVGCHIEIVQNLLKNGARFGVPGRYYACRSKNNHTLYNGPRPIC